jgi:hypothetical protein
MDRLIVGYPILLRIEGVTRENRQFDMLTLSVDEGIYKY